jgi:hypothetical protein
MVVIDQSNAEELLFYDKKVRQFLPELRVHFDQWHLAITLPGLKSMGRRAVLDLLSAIGQDQLRALETYFGEKVEVHKIDYHIVANVTVSTNHPDISLEHPFVGVAPYRTSNTLELTFWR